MRGVEVVRFTYDLTVASRDDGHTSKRKPLAVSTHAQKVRDIIEKELGVEREKLSDDASFIEDLGADSLDIVELVMAFEEEFGVEIPDDAAEKITTVKDAISYIDTHKG